MCTGIPNSRFEDFNQDPEPLSPIPTLGVNPFPYLIIFRTLRDLGFPDHFLEWPIRAKLLIGHAPLISAACSCRDTIRELKQTATATGTGTSPNKRFNEQNNAYARALSIFADFVAVLFQRTTSNDQVWRILENVNHDGKYFGFPYGIDRWQYIFGLSRFLDRLSL